MKLKFCKQLTMLGYRTLVGLLGGRAWSDDLTREQAEAMAVRRRGAGAGAVR